MSAEQVFGAFTICFCLLTFGVWLATFLRSHRLFYRFREKYPEVAKTEIPHAFEINAHPEKFLYFFRSKSVELLRRDVTLWPLRQQVKRLAILSGLMPVLGFLALAALGIFLASRQ
jgi:hypothetical protein